MGEWDKREKSVSLLSLSSERDWGTHEALWKAGEPLGVSHKGDAKAREVEGVDVLPRLIAEVSKHGEDGESSQEGGQGVDDGDHGSVSDVGSPAGLG